MRKFSVDRLNVQVCADRAALGKAAALRASTIIGAALKTKDHVRVVFAAAPSQNEMLAALVADTRIDWSRIEAFHMDEYIGLGTEAPQLFGSYLYYHIFSRVPMMRVHYLDGQTTDRAYECSRYTMLLQQGSIDLVCMGIGENGHIAFNDPPVADFEDSAFVKVVRLDDACRAQQVHDGCFPDIEQVPRHALTLTVPALMAAHALVAAVPGPAKAAAVRTALEGPIATSCPASILRTHPSADLFLDDESSALLRTPAHTLMIGGRVA
jgi:glucosamine-6-phosphate deaminase